jgi:hypothetical protein
MASYTPFRLEATWTVDGLDALRIPTPEPATRLWVAAWLLDHAADLVDVLGLGEQARQVETTRGRGAGTVATQDGSASPLSATPAAEPD